MRLVAAVECLARPHGVEIVIRLELEHVQNLIQHLAMLRRDADSRFERFRVGQEVANYRAKLDRLRSSPKNKQYFTLLHHPPR